MKPTLFLFAVLIFILSGLTSCKKEEHTSTPPTPIFTLNFTQKFIPDQIPVIVFLSDPEGKIILDTVCTSNMTYLLYPPSGKTIPEKFMVTIINSEIPWHNLTAHINTYTNVAKGSEWTLKGTKPDSVGKATISLINFPALSGPILYSNSGYSNETLNPSDRIAVLYQTPDELYVKIQTGEGQFYKITDIARNGNYAIDMSDASQAESHTISFPLSAENYEARLYGYKDADYDSPIPVTADNLISEGVPASSIDMHYPASFFSGFHTKLMLQETYTSEVTWFYQTEGSIPDEFVQIDADILSMQPQTGSLSIQTSGTFDMVAAHWQFIDHTLVFYEWQIFAPDTTATIIIPEIPPAFKQMFPTASLDSLIFQYAELTELFTLSSYYELIGKLFDPSHPQQMDRFDASSLRKNFIPWNSK